MSSVALVLKANKADQQGKMPLYLRIIKNRKTQFISLKQKVHPDEWDEDKQRVKKRFPNSVRVNALLAQKVAEAEGVVVTLEIKEDYVSSKKIKQSIIGRDSVSLIKYLEEYQQSLHSRGKTGTHDKVTAVLYKLKKYIKNKDLSFDEMDYQFLKRYETYLRDVLKNSVNTIHSNLKIFRKVFNDAVREDLIEPQHNPFLKYKLKTEKSNKQFLTEEELELIDALPLKEGTVMFHHRNMYVFAAYAGGIRISDILQLRWQNFDGTHIRVTMQKTKETVPVKLAPKAMQIIEHYSIQQPDRKKSDFIFPMLHNDIDYSVPAVLFRAISSNTAYANKNLKIIAEKAGVEKHISFHTSRHTFATRALKKGMRIEYVSKIMGHQKIQTTQIYTKIVNTDLDEAMNVFE